MYTNETTHYGIPLPLGSDLTTPMDYNESMQDVDTALFESKTDSSSALQKANQLQQDLSTTNDNVTGVAGRVTTLEGTTTTQGQAIIQNTQDIADVRADALDMIAAKDEGTAQVASVAVTKGEYFRYNDVLYIATQAIAVGDTIVPNTNCRATNVGTELNQLNNNLNAVASDVYSAGVALISADITSAQELTPSQPFTNFNTIKARIGAYYSSQNRNLYMQAFDIDLRHLDGYADEFIYSWYQSPANFMSVEFGIVNGKLQINAIQLGTDTEQNFAVYVEAYGYKQTL